MDNQTAVSYITQQGGTKSLALHQLATKILHWAEAHVEDLTAVYIPGSQNMIADHLSRRFPSRGEWAISSHYIQPIFARRGAPNVDLMATPGNAQVPEFATRFRYNEAIAQDTFSILLQFTLVYLFSSIPLILRTLLKIVKEEVHAILNVPFWPRMPWFPLLLQMASAPPVHLPFKRDLLQQEQ